MNSIFRENFEYLACVLNGGITKFGTDNPDIFTNSNYASDYHLEKKAFDSTQQKALELKYDLPSNWFYRNNRKLIKMNEIEFALFERITQLSSEKKHALLELLS